MYCIYLIKRPGVYFRSKSLEGAFKRGGRLFMSKSFALFLGYCLSLNLFLSLNLSHRNALCVGISLCHRCIIKKYFYSMLLRLQNWVPCAISAPPTVPRPIHGWIWWAFIDLGVYSRRAFNQVNTVRLLRPDITFRVWFEVWKHNNSRQSRKLVIRFEVNLYSPN